MAIADALDAVRRPEYTGENRCTPCTLVNAGIAVALAAGVAVLAPLPAAGAAALGGGVLLVAAAAIYLRGYLVPGTPRLTKTYLPDRVLRYFEHGAAGGTLVGADDVDPAAALEAAGALVECADEDDLCLEDAFRADWSARIDRSREADTPREDLAAVLGFPAEALEIQTHGDAFVAMAHGAKVPGANFTHRHHVGQWESRGAFLADVAGAAVLDERWPGWADLDARARGQVLNGLRVFLDACPSCGGPVSFGEETVSSCCRSRQVVAITCDDCGARLFEADAPGAA